MKRITEFGFSIISCFILVMSLVSMVASDSDTPKWEVGNEWKYEMKVMGIEGTVTHKVSEITNIEVKGTNYEVYHVEVIGSGGTEHMYYTTSDLSLVKMEIPSTSVSSALTFTYHPPKLDFNFPHAVGKTWNSTYNMTIITGEADPVNVTMNEDYEVIKMENLTVAAGTFECFRIESLDRFENIHTTKWYSEDVKNIVKSSVNMTGIITEMEFVSFSTGDKENGVDSQDLPLLSLFIIISIIIFISVVLLVMRGKKKKANREQTRQTTKETPLYRNIPPSPPSKKPPQSP